ncbi:MAG: hypothetical protein ACKOFY_05680 [Candidatus Limnocylindrus sp.]
MPEELSEREMRSKRVVALAASRPAVAERLATVRRSREASLQRVRSIGSRLRPSGGLGQELRDRPLRALGLLGILALLLVRWFGSRSEGSKRPGGGAGSAFVSGIVAAAAQRGGRAVLDAVIDGRPAVDGTPVGNDDARGRVAKR